MIYAAQLYAGDWYVCTETNAPAQARNAIEALPQRIFDWNQEREAHAAAALARRWTRENAWRLVATDSETGEAVTLCAQWIGEPMEGLRQCGFFGSNCYGAKAIPLSSIARDEARYLKIAEWLRRRYTVRHRLVTHRAGQPTTYTRRETLAFQRYILATI